MTRTMSPTEEAALAETIARLVVVAGDSATSTVSPRSLAIEGALASAPPLPSAPVVRELPRIEIGESSQAELEITGPLAQGGMGRIDLAVQHALRRTVAIKRVRSDRQCVPAVKALLSEGRVVGGLEHPNIVPVHALGRGPDGDPVLVMKRIEGVAWEALIRDPEHPGWHTNSDRLTRHLEILVSVCNALEFAHRRGIVHCDLKPSNVMVGELGEVFLLDWGVAVSAEVERTTDIAGTPAYMAPEMLGGTVAVTPRTDVYLLGATLHEVLTGRPRHAGATLPEVVVSIVDSSPVDFGPSVSSELAAICNRAMARDPAERFPSAIALRDALTEHMRRRSSMELVTEGERLLLQLERLLESGCDDEAAVTAARRLAAESDFAFRQALRLWSDNEQATARRRHGTLLILSLEIARRNGPGAKALLDEVADPPQALVARVRDLLADVASQERAREELERAARENSFSIAARSRMIVIGVFYLALLVVSVGLGLGRVALTTGRLFAIDSFFVVGYMVLVLALRHSLFANVVNRRNQLGVAIMLALQWTSLLACWVTDQSVQLTFVVFAGVFVTSILQAAVWSEPSMTLYLLAAVGGLVAMWLWPSDGFAWISAVAGSALVAVAIRLRLRRPPRAAHEGR